MHHNIIIKNCDVTQVEKEILVDGVQFVDNEPREGSNNLITSDGVARAVAGASGEVPQVTENDNGKVLKAIYDEHGSSVKWESEPAVDQVYNAESPNAQSGVAVAEAIGSVNQVPAYSEADSGEVSQVQADGTLAWVTLS